MQSDCRAALAALCLLTASCAVTEPAAPPPSGPVPTTGTEPAPTAPPEDDPAAFACAAFEAEDDATVFNFVSDKTYSWEPGSKLVVGFLDGKRDYRQRVAAVASEWSKHANIDLVFAVDADPPPDDATVRISFKGSGYWSLIGSQAAFRDRSLPTMNFNWQLFAAGDREIQRVVLHEFGHALGLWHEHQNPNLKVTWNKPYIYDYYRRKSGWTREMVDHNIFRLLDPDEVDATEFDPASIMVYAFPREFTVEPIEIPYNWQLSPTDKTEIAALYPGRAAPDEPEPPAIDVAALAAQIGFDFSITSTTADGKLTNYKMAVKAPRSVLDAIDHVLYQRQHQSFREYAAGTYYRSGGRASRFAFEWQGWGWARVKARVVWKNGAVTAHLHDHSPRRPSAGPDWNAIKSKVGFSYVQSPPRDGWSTYAIALSDPDVAPHIHWIDYQRQHQTFSEHAEGRFVRVSARAEQFALVWRGYGWVPVEAVVKFADGSEKRYRIDSAPTVVR